MAIDVSKVSKLGFGLMRLPQSEDGEVDLARVCDMVDAYMEKGFNYFDTAYVYHGGKSEVVAREAIVKRYPRDSFYLATKLPSWEIKSKEDQERIFNEQLERSGAGYFDFYLLHSMEDGEHYNDYTKYDSFGFAMEKKAQGLVKHVGFSFHGSPELLVKVLDEHPETEFVQIQLNYLDMENPLIQSRKLYEILHERNIPMIIMEPVKGGFLANPIPEVVDLFEQTRPGASAASYALRYVASLDGIMTILSGMSTEDQMADNLNTFSNFEPLSDKEQDVIKEAVNKMLSIPTIGCTGCRYCTDGCPSGIRIPDIFRAVNTLHMYPSDPNRPRFFYNGLVSESGRASDCVACGQCEGVCPQHLNIIELLKDASATFDAK